MEIICKTIIFYVFFLQPLLFNTQSHPLFTVGTCCHRPLMSRKALCLLSSLQTQGSLSYFLRNETAYSTKPSLQSNKTQSFIVVDPVLFFLSFFWECYLVTAKCQACMQALCSIDFCIFHYVSFLLSYSSKHCSVERPGWSLYWQTYVQGCIPCSPGTYKPDSGFSSCLPCPVSTYSAASPSDSVGVGLAGGAVTCVHCPANTTVPAGSAALSTACTCVLGFYTNKSIVGNDGQTQTLGMQCIPCPTGTYQSEIGASMCTACGSGTYSVVVAATAHAQCAECLHGSAPTSTGSACECIPGFYPINGGGGDSCMACPAGTFTSAPGTASCANCPAGTFATESIEASACAFCPAGTYSNETALWQAESCIPCPVASTSQAGSVTEKKCLCNAGFFGVDTVCTACPAGQPQSPRLHAVKSLPV